MINNCFNQLNWLTKYYYLSRFTPHGRVGSKRLYRNQRNKFCPEDILQGFELFYPILLRKSDELNGATRSFYKWLETHTEKETQFYASEIREKARLTPRTLRRYLKTLTDYGKLMIVGGNQKKGFAYQIVSESVAIEPILQKHLQAIKRKLSK